MYKIIPLVIVGLFTSGCATITALPPETVRIAIKQCPLLKQYSKQQLIQAASELQQLPTNSQIAALVSDYSKLRDACRVAQKKLSQQFQ